MSNPICSIHKILTYHPLPSGLPHSLIHIQSQLETKGFCFHLDTSPHLSHSERQISLGYSLERMGFCGPDGVAYQTSLSRNLQNPHIISGISLLSHPAVNVQRSVRLFPHRVTFNHIGNWVDCICHPNKILQGLGHVKNRPRRNHSSVRFALPCVYCAGGVGHGSEPEAHRGGAV